MNLMKEQFSLSLARFETKTQLLTIVLGKLIGFFLSSTIPQPAFGQGAAPIISHSEYFSGSCAKLAELTSEEIASLIHPRNQEYFYDFCYPEDHFNCSDYDAYIHRWGKLKAYDGYACRYIPRIVSAIKKHQEAP